MKISKSRLQQIIVEEIQKAKKAENLDESVKSFAKAALIALGLVTTSAGKAQAADTNTGKIYLNFDKDEARNLLKGILATAQKISADEQSREACKQAILFINRGYGSIDPNSNDLVTNILMRAATAGDILKDNITKLGGMEQQNRQIWKETYDEIIKAGRATTLEVDEDFSTIPFYKLPIGHLPRGTSYTTIGGITPATGAGQVFVKHSFMQDGGSGFDLARLTPKTTDGTAIAKR